MRLELPDGRYVLSHNNFDELDGLTAEPPEVSVVIPYYEAQADLDLVLTALARQTHPLTRLEVVVVDDGSTVEPALHAAGPLTVSLLRQERKGFRAAAARNAGARAAGGSIVCFLDGDTIPASGYVAAASRLPALCPDALVVGNRRHADLAGWLPADVQSGRLPPELPAPAWLESGYRESRNLLDADARSFRYVLSAVMTCSTALFGELEFDESFTSYGGEDWEFAARAYQAGAVLAHEPAAVAWHNGPDWAGRGGDPAAKNAETLMLAELITAPGTRGRGLAYDFPALVVTIDARGWTAAACQLTVDAALAAGDVGVWLLGDAARLLRDARVREGKPSAEVLARAQQTVAIMGPCVIDHRSLSQVEGRVSCSDPAGMLVEVTNTRAAGRVGRWAGDFPTLDLFAALFPSAPTVLAHRIPDEPDLAGWFGGWAYQQGTP